jgi:hypothetical protein
MPGAPGVGVIAAGDMPDGDGLPGGGTEVPGGVAVGRGAVGSVGSESRSSESPTAPAHAAVRQVEATSQRGSLGETERGGRGRRSSCMSGPPPP